MPFQKPLIAAHMVAAVCNIVFSSRFLNKQHIVAVGKDFLQLFPIHFCSSLSRNSHTSEINNRAFAGADLGDGSALFSDNFIHQLHCFDNARERRPYGPCPRSVQRVPCFRSEHGKTHRPLANILRSHRRQASLCCWGKRPPFEQSAGVLSFRSSRTADAVFIDLKAGKAKFLPVRSAYVADSRFFHCQNPL